MCGISCHWVGVRQEYGILKVTTVGNIDCNYWSTILHVILGLPLIIVSITAAVRPEQYGVPNR